MISMVQIEAYSRYNSVAILFESKYFNWIKLVTWLVTANQSSLRRCSMVVLKFVYAMSFRFEGVVPRSNLDARTLPPVVSPILVRS